MIECGSVDACLAKCANALGERSEESFDQPDNPCTLWVGAKKQQHFVKANQRFGIPELPTVKSDQYALDLKVFAPVESAL